MLKYFKAFAMIAIIALGVLTVSCQKEDLTPTEKVEISTLDGTADSTINDPTVLQSRNWNFLSYSSTVSQNYTLYSAIQLSEKKYRFVVISNSSNSNEELYVKTYCHTDGLDNYKKLQRINPYSTPKMYMVDSIFDRSALYSYKYFVREDPNTNNLRPLSTGTSPTFTTLVVPASGDDYHSVADHIYAGIDPDTGIPMYMDQWNFYYEECVSWVACKVNEMWGTETTFHNKMFGNNNRLSYAYTWKDKFLQQGYSVDQNPQAGDIMWYPSSNNMPKGHVAFVHEVVNGTIYYSYYNNYGDHQYHYTSISTNSIGNKYFIHVQQKL